MRYDDDEKKAFLQRNTLGIAQFNEHCIIKSGWNYSEEVMGSLKY